MPIIDHQSLRRIGYQLFEGVGCSSDHARIVSDHLVDSSLYGHDSHGYLRFSEYPRQFKDCGWNPAGVPEIIDERPCTAIVDGNGTMGQVGGKFATEVAMRKAKEHGVATVTLRNASHVCRAGEYPLIASRENMIAMMFTNGGRLGCQVAPHGGLDGKMCTNPISFAAPRRNDNPIMVDMATSVVADGKVRVARNSGKPTPDGWLIDRDGNPTNDPNVFTERRGALLSLGGVASHKGHCLNIIVELLGGALGGQGVANGATYLKSNGVLITVYHIEHFTDLDTFFDEVEILVDHVKSSRIDPRIGEIQMPGEPEFRTAEKRRRDGIEIDAVSWSDTCDCGKELGLDTDAWNQMLEA